MGDRAGRLGLIVLAIAGCTARPLFSDTEGGEGTSGDATSGSGDTRDETTIADSGGSDAPFDPDVGTVAPPPPTQRFVSILFVIDDSVTMGSAQRVLTTSIPALVDPLDANKVDYRIAFTTTDNGNFWCGDDFISPPEAGNFVSSSCVMRLPDFVSTQAVEHDVCLDRCGMEELPLQPTTTEIDPTPRVRPWLESVGGLTNLPPETTMLDALHCVLPQGVAGCGFEQPLESMYKAIRRTTTAGEDEQGFFNAGGLAVVIIVTDEADCSTNNEYDEIFDPEGSRVFWSNPDDPVPSSALCWYAGVSCEGLNSALTCKAENHDTQGTPGVADNLAVMHPVSRYADVLAELGNTYVAAIDGVPVGFSDGTASIVYTTLGVDAQYLHDFGIGPGCTLGEQRAVPSVRVKEVIERASAATTTDLFSICQTDYSIDLGEIANRIIARLPS